MQIITTDMSFKLPEKYLIDRLKKQNRVLKNRTIEIIKIFETRRKSRTISNARIKIDQESYKSYFMSELILDGKDAVFMMARL